MLDALYIAATGMRAEQTHLDTVSNNLANLNTTSFKKSRVEFSDLLYKQSTLATSELNNLISDSEQGIGTSVSKISKDFGLGELKATQNPLHIAIRGDGFLEVELSNGQTGFTRNGILSIDSEGYLETIDGYRLSKGIQLPPDTSQLTISPEGIVYASFDASAVPMEIGQIELALFVNTQGLKPVGGSLYLESDSSGIPTYVEPGDFGSGEISQGYLESSNVDLVEELLELTLAQRAYEVNSKVIKAADEILKINNSLRS